MMIGEGAAYSRERDAEAREKKREMAVAPNWIAARNINRLNYPCCAVRSRACLGKSDNFSRIARKNNRNRKPLVKISTNADGKWSNNWSINYKFSLQELQLHDLAIEEGDEKTQVSISIHIQQHASFGLSVDGKIVAYFTTKCSSCSLPYSKKIDTDFNVLILSTKRHSDETQLPEIGFDDQVIYVKPGNEASLDSLIQDAIRLSMSVKDTCSESCEKTTTIIQYHGEQEAASIDRRWSKLLELRNVLQQ